MLVASTVADVVGPLAAPALAARWGDRLAVNILIALTAVARALGATSHVAPVFVAGVITQAFTQMALVPLLFGVAVRSAGGESVAPLIYGSILFGCSARPLLGGVTFEPSGWRLAAVCVLLCVLSGSFIRVAHKRNVVKFAKTP